MTRMQRGALPRSVRCSSSSSAACPAPARASRSTCWKTAATTAWTTCRRSLLPELVDFLQPGGLHARRRQRRRAQRRARSMQLPASIAELRQRGIDLHVLFLDAKTDTLVKRFSETRRRHPLSRRHAHAARMHRARARTARRHRRPRPSHRHQRPHPQRAARLDQGFRRARPAPA